MVNIVLEARNFGPAYTVPEYKFKLYAGSLNKQLRDAHTLEMEREHDPVVKYLKNPKPPINDVTRAFIECSTNAQFTRLLKQLPPAITEFVKIHRENALHFARNYKYKIRKSLEKSTPAKDRDFMFFVLQDFQKYKDQNARYPVRIANYRYILDKLRNTHRSTFAYATCICKEPKFKWLAFRLRKVFLIHYTGKDDRTYPLSLFINKTNPYNQKIPKIGTKPKQQTPDEILAEYQDGYAQDFLDAV
jgi:hypothetical protein